MCVFNFNTCAQRYERSQCVFDLLHFTLTCAAPPLPSSDRRRNLLRWYLWMWMWQQKRIQQTSTTGDGVWVVDSSAACSRSRLCLCSFCNELLGRGAICCGVQKMLLQVVYSSIVVDGGTITTERQQNTSQFHITKNAPYAMSHNRWNIFLSVFFSFSFRSFFSSLLFDSWEFSRCDWHKRPNKTNIEINEQRVCEREEEGEWEKNIMLKADERWNENEDETDRPVSIAALRRRV